MAASYRYRTQALLGPWRTSRKLAIADAIKAGQAEKDLLKPDGCDWLVRGVIEIENDRLHS